MVDFRSTRNYHLNGRNVIPCSGFFFQLIQSQQVGSFVVAQIKYTTCTTFDGNKIIVFDGMKIDDLMKLKTIDPHFSEEVKNCHPIARFMPTPEGWNHAIKFCEMLSVEQSACPQYSF
jgi:hypothetical protein